MLQDATTDYPVFGDCFILHNKRYDCVPCHDEPKQTAREYYLLSVCVVIVAARDRAKTKRKKKQKQKTLRMPLLVPVPVHVGKTLILDFSFV